MIVPYMGYFIVEGLGFEPWVMSVYSLIAIGLAVTMNRVNARRIDDGGRVHPQVGIAAFGFMAASVSVALFPTLPMVMTMGVVGFGISSSAVSTMFSLGGHMAERQGISRMRFNAYMRATTSTAWMVGPAVSFLIADAFGAITVFRAGTMAAALWLALWWFWLPRDVTAGAATPLPGAVSTQGNRALLLAAGFVFCVAAAHSLTFAALPLFYITEVGLPGFAPGTAFSVKTLVEVVAVFTTPYLIARFGIRAPLLAVTLLAVITIQVLASVQTFGEMLFGAALEGLYYGLFSSLGISYVQSLAPHRPAAATALYWNAVMASGILAGPAAGMIAQLWSFHAAIQVSSAVAFCAAGILLIGARLTAEAKPAQG